MRGAQGEHLVVGAGLSGLLLARQLLARAPRGPGGVTLVEPCPPDRGARVTYAYWADRETPLDHWAIGSWHTLSVVGGDRRVQQIVALDRWRYTAVDWARARAELWAEMAAHPAVTIEPHAVDDLRSVGERVTARLDDGRWLSASWGYDSRPPPAGARRAPAGAMGRRGVTLLQAFRGVWVRTQSDVISTAAATLLDFSGDDGPDLGFAYVLPVSSRFALVMAVRMAEEAHVPDPVPAVSRVVGGADWSVEAEEQGVTALVTPSPRRRLGPRVLAIGRRGGRVRPSTGYAVTRVLSDSVAIRRSLDRYGHPFALPRDPHWQGVLDAIWLKALRRERAALEPAFVSLFTRAPVGSVLRFLDGHASLSDVRSVVRALPPAPFVRAALTRG